MHHDRARLAHALAVTTLIQIIATATALALPPIAPRAALDFGIAPYVVGYQISLIYLAGAIGSAASGTLIARYGAERVEIAALLLFSAGLALLATATLSLAVIASILIGIGYGIQNPASSHILNQVAPPHRRNIIFSIKQAGVPLGAVVASLLFPLADAMIGWRAAFPVLALLPLLLVIHMARAHRAPGRQGVGQASFIRGFVEDQTLVWRRAELRILSLLGLLYSAAQLSLSAFVVLMLVEDGGWSLIAAGGVAGLVQLFGALGRVLWGWLGDRTGQGLVILSAIGLVSAAVMASFPWFAWLPVGVQLALLCLLGLCLSGWNGLCMGEIARHSAPGQTGRVMGGALVYTFIGVVIGPSSFAAIFALSGRYGTTFAILGILTLAGGIAAAAAARHDHRRAPPAQTI